MEQCVCRAGPAGRCFPPSHGRLLHGVVSSPSLGGFKQTWVMDLQSGAWSSGRDWTRPGPHEGSLMMNECSGTWEALGPPCRVGLRVWGGARGSPAISAAAPGSESPGSRTPLCSQGSRRAGVCVLDPPPHPWGRDSAQLGADPHLACVDRLNTQGGRRPFPLPAPGL